jgi:prophage maintenance system killer protein
MTVADIFLEINGHDVKANHLELTELMVGIAEKKISRDEAAAFFSKNSYPI